MLDYVAVLTLTPSKTTEADILRLRDAGFGDEAVLEINQIALPQPMVRAHKPSVSGLERTQSCSATCADSAHATWKTVGSNG